MPNSRDTYIQASIRQRELEDRDEARNRASTPAMLLASAAMGATSLAGSIIRSGQVRQMAADVDVYLRRNKYFKKLIPSIYEGTESTIRKTGVTKQMARDAVKNRHVQQLGDLDSIYAIARGKSPFAGAKDVAVGAALEGMLKYAPRKYTHNVRDLTIQDLVAGGTRLQKQVESTLGSESGRVASAFDSIMNTAAGRTYLSKKGINRMQLAKRIRVGDGLHVGNERLIDTGVFHPNNLASWMGNFKFPFTSWKPFELLFPTELAYRQPIVQEIRGAFTENMLKGLGRKEEELLYAGGQAFPIMREGRRKVLGNTPLPGEYYVGRTSSGMFKGARARAGFDPGWATPEEYLRHEGVLTPEMASRVRKERQEGANITYNHLSAVAEKGLSRLGKAKIRAAVIGHKVGVGPQFATRESKVAGMWKNLRNSYAGNLRTTSEVLSGAAKTPSARLTGDSWMDKIRTRLGMPKKTKIPLTQFTMMDKIKSYFGIEPKRTLQIHTESGKTRIENIPIAKFGGGSAMPDRPRGLGEFYLTPKSPGSLKAGQALGDWFNYQIMRPSWLLEESLGINMRPGKTAIGTTANVVGKIAGPVALTAAALSYVDYKSRQFEVPGPITTAVKGFSKARVGFQNLLDETGITGMAQEWEDKYPGLFTSPLSKGIRAGASTLGGVALAKAGFGLPAVLGGLSGAFVNAFTDITETSTELEAIYAGEQEIPVRKGRWWMLGRHGFEGEKVDYYRKHWLPLMLGKYKDVGLYGSETGAWEQSYLPTPENKFGLSKLFDPYRTEREHYYDRPYPVTGSPGKNIPLVGPLLGSKLSPLHYLKPQYRMHKDAWVGNRMVDNAISSPSELASRYMGIAPRMTQEASVLKTRLDQMTGEQLYMLAQWTGMTGFMAGQIKQALTGSDDAFDRRSQLADSNAMASTQRDYYDREFGGLLGFTEFFRRFVPRGRSQIQQINPIANTMPNWLPGSSSTFERDRDNRIDFTLGDAYTKVQMGESRLPGRGYESLHTLHSGVSGEYDALDRFKILADVAPGSESYRHHKQLVESMALSGSSKTQYENLLNQVDERMGSRYEERKDKTVFQDKAVQVAESMGSTRFRSVEGQVYSLAGVEERSMAQQWKTTLRERDTESLATKYDTLAMQLQNLEGKTVQVKAGTRGLNDTIPAIIPGINDNMANAAVAKDARTPADYQAKYGRGAMTKLWDNVRHLQIPGPAGWLPTKSFTKRTAAEEYQMAELEGGGFAGWDSPYKNFTRFWGRQAENTLRSEPAIPTDVHEARALDEHLSYMKYTKGRRMQNVAMAAGMQESADIYERMWQSSMPGLQVQGSQLTRDIWGAMPKTEKPYFKAFANESDPVEQKRIMGMVPASMKNVYMGIWKSGSPLTGDFSAVPNPVLNDQVDRAIIDQKAKDYFSTSSLASQDWQGWNPNVDPEDVRVATVAHHASDIHQHSVWESQVRSVTERNVPYAPYGPPTGHEEDEDLMWDSLSARQRRLYSYNKMHASSSGTDYSQMVNYG